MVQSLNLNSVLHVVPIESIEDRYSAQWNRWWPIELNKLDVPFKWYYPDGNIPVPKGEHFLDPIGTHIFKARQLDLLCQAIAYGRIADGDTILFHDLWFPGLEALFYIRDLLGKKFKIAGLLHAGTYTKGDVLERFGLQRWAAAIESAWFNEVDAIFVATHYHKNLLLKDRVYRHNKVNVTGFPMHYQEFMHHQRPQEHKENIAVFPYRIADERGAQEWDELVRSVAERMPGWQFIRSKDVCKTKAEYYDLLSRAKIVVSTSKQETWGIAVQEAVLLGCIPILPDNFSYCEMYPTLFRYETLEEAANMLVTFGANAKHLAQYTMPKVREEIMVSGSMAIENMMLILNPPWKDKE